MFTEVAEAGALILHELNLVSLAHAPPLTRPLCAVDVIANVDAIIVISCNLEALASLRMVLLAKLAALLATATHVGGTGTVLTFASRRPKVAVARHGVSVAASLR